MPILRKYHSIAFVIISETQFVPQALQVPLINLRLSSMNNSGLFMPKSAFEQWSHQVSFR